ncbi:ATP-grasp domain-containing protein [Sporofaciens musculi]|uniref:ATP-grasp domain-containing protein n=1 Tax=Sporofaciens musculi TaxID=2681861 RepID=UPI001951272C|nr:ATP-grasp domain-containing protein [Sporofaciens musculi]
MNKYKVLELAKKYGLKTLDTVCVKKNVIPKGIEYPVITKSISPVEGGWKADVHICHSENELKIAYEKIKASTVILQKYIEKKNEYCVDGFCADRGRIMFNAIESTYNYLIPGYYSPYMTVKKFNNPDLREAMEGIMKEIEFEGIYSIEFLIDQDDTYYFSEINFRNSTWSYAATCAGMNLPVLWAKAMVSGKLETAEEDIWVEDFMAMVEPIDYGKRVKPKEIGLGEWLIDFKEAKCAFYYNKEDPEPFIHMCKNWEKFS